MNEFYDRLDELYLEGDLSAVEAFITGELNSAAEGSLSRAGLLNELACFYRGVSRYDESEDAFVRSLSIFKEAGMDLSPQYATVLVNLAGLYRIRGEQEKSIDLFLDAKQRITDAGATDSYEYISVLNNLSLAYQENAEHQKAFEYAGEAFELIRAGGYGDHELATSLNNMATINISLGDYTNANAMVSAALDIYGKMETPDVHHAAALTTQAVLCSREGDSEGALRGFKQALDLTHRFFGENIEFAICRRNISEIYEMLGDIPSAAEELADAVRVMEKLLGRNHPSTVKARDKLGVLRGQNRSGFEASV